MGWTRASATDRELNCPGSLILPRAPDQPNEAALWGTMVHTWKETGLIIPSKEYPNHGPLFTRKLNRYTPDKENLWPTSGLHEIGVAISCTEPKAVLAEGLSKEELDRWKETWPDEYITGAIDYKGVVLDNPWVSDLKTGRWDDPLEKPPRRRAQVWTYATGVWLVERSEKVVVSIEWWPRYPVASEVLPVFQSISAEECDKWWRRLNKKHTQLVQIRKKPETVYDHLKEGEWCRFCPSKAYCPLKEGKE